MYRSIHSGLTPPTASTFLTKSNVFCGSAINLGGNTDPDPIQRRSYQSHKLTRKAATFGQARVPRSAPDEYLRKNGGSGKIPSIKPFSYGDEAKRKPGIPTQGDEPVHGLTTSKNFITANAIENILTEPPKLTTYGSDQYLYRKDYGNVPQYLLKMQARHGKMMETLQTQELQRIKHEQDKVKLLSSDEKVGCIRALKAKWDFVNEEYQKGSTLDLKKLDTMSKVRRKEQYEAELQQLESYIDRLSSRRNVFVTA